MRKFQFKFAAVLKLRKSKEEEALLSLARAQRKYQAELQQKARLQRDLARSLERRELLSEVTVDSVPYRMENEFISGSKHRLAQQEQAIFRAGKQVEKALRSYLHARRQTKMVETLYDRAYSDYRKERAKYEQKQQDDMTIMRARLPGLMNAKSLGEEETA